MKALSKLLLMLLVFAMLCGSLISCDLFGSDEDDTSDTSGDDQSTVTKPKVDYVADVKFNPNSGRNYLETTVKYYIDGDTTHFNVPRSISETGILKARYLGVNTPESTGQIEPWGKKASAFTRSKLESATSIIIESDNNKWNPDSTGERYLVWVWYKSADMTDYRNLNLELIQEGFSKGSNAADTVYASACAQVFNQAMDLKLHVFSQEKDLDFYYGDAQPITLKELKTNIEAYANTRVAFEGVVTTEYNNSTIYVEEYDEESDSYFGMQVFYGYGANWFIKDILTIGNRVRIAGSVQYYENGGTWQISDIKYDPYDPESKDNIAKISTNQPASYKELNVNNLLNGKLTFDVTVVDENDNETIEKRTFDYGYIVLYSTATLKNLTIKDVYTTKQGASKGAMSITCEDENGDEIVVRTIVLVDADGNQITDEAFPIGSVIDVKGIVDYYDGEYQLQLSSLSDVTFH